MSPVLRDLTNPLYSNPPLNLFVLATNYPLPEGSRALITEKFVCCRDMHLLAHQQEWAGAEYFPPLEFELESDLRRVEDWLNVPRKRDAAEAYIAGWFAISDKSHSNVQKRGAA